MQRGSFDIKMNLKTINLRSSGARQLTRWRFGFAPKRETADSSQLTRVTLPYNARRRRVPHAIPAATINRNVEGSGTTCKLSRKIRCVASLSSNPSSNRRLPSSEFCVSPKAILAKFPEISLPVMIVNSFNDPRLNPAASISNKPSRNRLPSTNSSSCCPNARPLMSI